jgi:hypothetical protein
VYLNDNEQKEEKVSQADDGRICASVSRSAE